MDFCISTSNFFFEQNVSCLVNKKIILLIKYFKDYYSIFLIPTLDAANQEAHQRKKLAQMDAMNKQLNKQLSNEGPLNESLDDSTSDSTSTT